VLGLALSLTAHAATVQIGPGADLAGATLVDTPGQDRLNVEHDAIALGAGTYDVLDFQLNVVGHTQGGTITPMLLTGAPSTYTTLWVGDAFDPTANGQQTAATYTPGSETFTLASAGSVFAGIFTQSGGAAIIGFAGGGTTSHDGNGFTAPTGVGQTVDGFSHSSIVRSYAFEINIDDTAGPLPAEVVVANGDSNASSTDLLQTHFGSVTGSIGAGGHADGPQGAESVLRNGSTPSDKVTGYAKTSTETVRISDGNVLTYHLDTTGTVGFEIDQIDIFHGWRDTGRDDLNSFDVAFEFIDNPGVFVDYLVGGSSGDYAADIGRVSVVSTDSDPIATGVSAVRLTFNSIQNTYGGFGEIDVIGSAVAIPTPAALPAGLVLIGLVALRRRSA